MINKSYITIPFFKSRVHLVRLDQAKDYILQHFRGIDAYDAPTDAVTCAYVDMIEGKTRNYFVMALPKKYDACTVVHESVHMAWFLLDYYQVELSRDNHEMLPMLVEELYRKASMKMYKVKV